MRQFVGKYMDVLQRDKGAAVIQLALQQPNASAVFRAASQLSSMQPTRALKWRNKSQEKDACIFTLSHTKAVSSVAVSATRIVSSSGNAIFVYDAESQELLEELKGTSEVMSIAIWDGGQGSGKDTDQAKSLIVASFQDGTIKVWDLVRWSPQIASPWPKLTLAGLSGRHDGAVEREEGCAQRRHHVGGVFPGRIEDCVGIVGQDDQSLGCRFVQPARNASRRRHGFQRRG